MDEEKININQAVTNCCSWSMCWSGFSEARRASAAWLYSGSSFWQCPHHGLGSMGSGALVTGIFSPQEGAHRIPRGLSRGPSGSHQRCLDGPDAPKWIWHSEWCHDPQENITHSPLQACAKQPWWTLPSCHLSVCTLILGSPHPRHPAASELFVSLFRPFQDSVSRVLIWVSLSQGTGKIKSSYATWCESADVNHEKWYQ